MTLRIRTMARLTGVREATLRAWERRYGFPEPERSDNNYRTYGPQEVDRVRRVVDLLGQGWSTGEAIAQAREVGPTVPDDRPILAQLSDRFWKAARELDTVRMEEVLSEAQTTLATGVLVDGFLVPLLRGMADALDVACEHAGSALVRHRLQSLVHLVGEPGRQGASVLLACPRGERHEGGLLALAVQLRRIGCRPTVLGADTPVEALIAAAQRLLPDVVALSLTRRGSEVELESYIRALVKGCPAVVVVGGTGVQGRETRLVAWGARVAGNAAQLVEATRSPRA